MNDAQLRAFHVGDERIFESAVATHSGRLLALLSGYARDSAVAEDLLQETWLRAYRRRETFRGDGSFLGWLLAISRGVAIDHLRKEKQEARRLVPAATAGVPVDHSSPSPDTVAELRELGDQLRKALAELPPRQRDTVVLRLIEDRSVQETAATMGCAQGTVKAALSQALDNLRGIMRANGQGGAE